MKTGKCIVDVEQLRSHPLHATVKALYRYWPQLAAQPTKLMPTSIGHPLADMLLVSVWSKDFRHPMSSTVAIPAGRDNVILRRIPTLMVGGEVVSPPISLLLPHKREIEKA